MKTKPLAVFFLLILSSCIFAGDEEVKTRHLTKDFFLQDYASSFSLIQQTKNAQTHAVILDGGLNAIGYNNDFIIAEQDLVQNGVATSLTYIISIRHYDPTTWQLANNIDTLYTDQELNVKRKALGIPDSILPSIANLNTEH